MKLTFIRSALAIVAGALEAAIRPPPAVRPSEWAAAHLIVPDGEYKGQKFDPTLTPYLIEPMDMLGPDSAVNEVAVMKSAQTGFTLMLLGVIGHPITRREDSCCEWESPDGRTYRDVSDEFEKRVLQQSAGAICAADGSRI